MKLFELLGVKRFHSMTKTEIINFIMRSNDEGKTDLRPAGDGTAATVFMDSHGSVYKFWVQDNGYEEFIKYVAKNQDNPFLPKLKSPIKTMRAFHRRPIIAPDTIRWIKMEMLAPNHKLGDYSVKFGKFKIQFVQLVNYFISLSDLLDNKEKIKRELDELMRSRKYISCDIPNEEYPDELIYLCQTSIDIGKIIDSNELLSNDLAAFNIMLRNGFPVIIDPIASVKDHRFNNHLKHYETAINNGTNRRILTKSGR